MSILSAASVISAVDRTRYEVIPIGINRSGQWYVIHADMEGIDSLSHPRFSSLIPEDLSAGNGGAAADAAVPLSMGDLPGLIDFAFPVLHGPYGEDGTVQGAFEMLGLPYAGCGVAASAVCMDKIFTKEILLRGGFPVCKHDATTAFDFGKDPSGELARIEAALGYPIFVKPANMGSSVGVSRAEDRAALEAAVIEALRFDRRVLLEPEITGRELETAILGNDDPQAGAVGEVTTTHSFYDYEAKYVSEEATKIHIPADIPGPVAERIRSTAIAAYRALDCAGFSRVDFFWDEQADRIYLNEINTIPGFTKYSMFPLLWREKGLAYPDLIERIIQLGYERYYLKNNR